MKRKKALARVYPGRLLYCPECRHALNVAADFVANDTARSPRPGDATVCGYCRAVLFVNADMTLRPATPAEKLEIFLMFENHPTARFAAKEIDIVGLPGYSGPETSSHEV